MVDIQLPLKPLATPVPKYRDRVNSRNIYPSDDDLGIPSLWAETWVPPRLVRFNDRAQFDDDAAAHFFLDDYRFEPLWSNPPRYIDSLAKCGAVLTPDFSVLLGTPLAMHIWQVYRNRWVGAYMQRLGMKVIPSVAWATPAEFYFAGLPMNGVLAIATTGLRREPESVDYFILGLKRLERLEPRCVLVYGGLSDIVDSTPFEVMEYPAWLDDNRPRMDGVRHITTSEEQQIGVW